MKLQVIYNDVAVVLSIFNGSKALEKRVVTIKLTKKQIDLLRPRELGTSAGQKLFEEIESITLVGKWND